MEEDNKLIQGIISKAETEAENIVKAAEKKAADNLRDSDLSIERIRTETDAKIASKLSAIEKRTSAAVKSEQRRQFLRRMEKIYADIHRLFQDRIISLAGTPEYADFLAKLIAEGAIAVNDSEVFVRCSFREKVDERILEKASACVFEATGRKIKLKISGDAALTAQGIIVQSSSGRISYNNQINTRLRRFEEDIKMIIADGLNKETSWKTE